MYELNDLPEQSRYDLLLKNFELLLQGHSIDFLTEDFTDLINFLIEKKDLQKAFLVIVQAINKFPKSFEIRISEAQVLIESGLNVAAIKKLKKLYAKRKKDISLLMLIAINFVKLSNFNKAEKFFGKIIENVDRDKDFLFYNISQIFLEADNYLLASKYLEQAYLLSPNDDSVILDLAFCYDRLNKFAKAEILFKTYLSHEPFSELAWFNYGVVLMEQHKTELAIEAFDFAIAIDTNFASPLFNKAQLVTKMDDNELAISLFSKFIELEPENSSAYFFRAKLFFHTKKHIEALKDLKLCLKIDKNNAYAWYLMAKIYMILSNKMRAKKAISLALSIDKKNQKFLKLASDLFI